MAVFENSDKKIIERDVSAVEAWLCDVAGLSSSSDSSI